ncbi:MAG TPA: metalloregulator ArsR/SmtB family transcription factor [Ktedonobacteraceae bacterium]|nr:metalloregulator ArsR/SmtB family transcription factor [Ktedonobacteraceae bacterium]
MTVPIQFHRQDAVELAEQRGGTMQNDVCLVHSVHPEQMLAVRQNTLPQEQAAQIVSLFAVLKDPTRLQVVYALLNAPAKELCVCDLAAGLGRDDTTISHQLRTLRDQRIVAMRKVGRVVYYRLIDDHVRQLLELALSHVREIPAAIQ